MSRTLRLTVGVLGLVALLAAGWFLLPSRTAPHLAVQDLARVPVTITAPYDEKADASAAVDAAFARAKQSRKRVLIDLGGNWCPDCIVLANVMALPDLKPFLEKNYEVVAVDVGRFDRNLQIPARFGITGRLEGVPSVLVVTPDGELVNAGSVTVLANATKMTPQGIADWLARWATADRAEAKP